MESLLAGQERLVLTTDPTAQAERIRAAGQAGVAAARLWQFPYQTLQRRSQLRVEDVSQRLDAMLPLFAAHGTPLFKGRILHLKGRFQGQPGAIECYQAARPATQDLVEAEPKLAASHYENELLPAVRQDAPRSAIQARGRGRYAVEGAGPLGGDLVSARQARRQLLARLDRGRAGRFPGGHRLLCQADTAGCGCQPLPCQEKIYRLPQLSQFHP